MENKIKNKGIKGCVICQNRELSELIDPIIFRAEMPLKDLQKKLEGQFIFLEIDQLKKHAGHIFYEDCRMDIVNGEINKIKKITSREMVEQELARIEKQIKKALREGREQDYLRFLREKKDLIAMKAKIEGELVDRIEHTIPGWVEELPDDESDKT